MPPVSPVRPLKGLPSISRFTRAKNYYKTVYLGVRAGTQDFG